MQTTNLFPGRMLVLAVTIMALVLTACDVIIVDETEQTFVEPSSQTTPVQPTFTPSSSSTMTMTMTATASVAAEQPAVETLVSLTPTPSPTPSPTPTASVTDTPTPTALPADDATDGSALPPGNWQPIPDLPRHINALAVDPTNPQVLYAGTGDHADSGSGVYKSQDAGLSWSLAATGLPRSRVLALAFNSGEPATLYALVEGDVFASVDGAQSWTRLGSTGFMGSYDCLLRADPHDPNVLLALSKSDSLARSSDGGYAWQPLSGGLPENSHGGVSVLALAVDPADAHIIYAGTGAFVGGGQGVCKSIDGGETWSLANRGMLDYRITALAVDPLHPQTVYAGADDGAFFKSSDGGQTWEDLTANLPLQTNTRPTIRDIVLDPATSKVYLLADGVGIVSSDDGGARWQALGNPAAPDRMSLTAMTALFDLAPEPILIMGVEDAGAWRYDVARPASQPADTTPPTAAATLAPLPLGRWQLISDLPRSVNTLVADPADPQILYASAGDMAAGGAVYKSTDAGQTWQPASSGLPNEAVLALAFSPGAPATLYAAIGISGETFASVDGAASWSRLGNAGLWGGFYRQLYTAPSDKNLLFTIARPGGVARSDDGGYTWGPFGAGAPQDEAGEVYALALAVDPTNADVVYLGTGGWVGQGYGVYKSTDRGESWSPANQGMLDYRISALALDPTQPQTIYAGGDSGELFKSSDGGQTWRDLTENLQIQQYLNVRTIRAIVIDPAAPETVYLLGDFVGVMISNDGGLKWRALAKPGEQDSPVFTAALIVPGAQPVLIVSLDNEGGCWRYASD